MLSRVAENLFWMSRYLERAENVARLLDIGLYLELDAPSSAGDDGSAPVEIALGILSSGNVAAPARTSVGPHRNAVLGFLTFDRTNPNSLVSTISRARENARGTQESLGVDAWSEINRLYLYLCGQRAQRRFHASASALYATVKQSCILFDGMVQNTLPRDEVYHFIRLGPPSRAGVRDGPDPPRQVPHATGGWRSHRPGDRAGALDRPAPKLLGLRRLPPRRARPRRARRGDPLPRA